MGLDFSHTDAHWSYSGFFAFRRRLFAAVMPRTDLDGMRGFAGACVGEGRHFIRTLFRSPLRAFELPCCWIPGETRDVVPDAGCCFGVEEVACGRPEEVQDRRILEGG